MAEKSRSQEFMGGLQQKWQQISLARKMSVIILTSAIMITLFFAGRLLLKPRMAPLFSGLEAADAGRITKKLQEMGIVYSLGQEGRTVLVPENKVYDLRIQLASDGTLIGGSAGFELFDTTKLGATDFNRRLDYQRALQEELRRTIVQLEEVQQARVHLALPEPSVFIEETATPSASIVLKLNSFASLKESQVRGIVLLVAGSVENLKPEEVTIVDTQGNVLSGEIWSDSSGQVADATSKQFAVRRAFEQELEVRLQRLLDRVLGAGQAIAMLTAELDFNASESTVITFGAEGVPRSHMVTKESWQGTGGTLPAEAGTDSNIPGYVVGTSTGETNYERSDETTNYEINEIKEKQVLAPGRLLRLHTAVILNAKDGQLTNEQIEQIQSTVAAAIGFQENRGDSIHVSGMNFDRSQQDAALEEFAKAERQARIERYITLGAYALAAFLILIFGLRFFAKWRERQLDRQLAALPAVPVSEEEDLLSVANVNTESKLRQRVRQLADKEPETAAFLIRAWLTEE